MPQTEEWTIGKLLNWTTDYLKRHGAESPKLEAEVLLAEARGCQRIDLYAEFDQPAGEQVRTAFREMVRRRIEGTPVAYLVGHKEFFSLSFRVNDAVLIPRPETEDLVLHVLDLIKARQKASSQDESTQPDRATTAHAIALADVGVGSGAIAVSIAKHAPTVHVTAVDISPETIKIAQANAEEHGVNDRIEFVESDLLEALPPEPTFDFVVSNPPYVSEQEFAELPREIREHEPRLALVAGETGAEVIAQLIPQAAQRLHSGGWLLMEISPMIEKQVISLIKDNSDFKTPAVIKVNGLARIVKAQRV